jgi:hypothetical protein
LICRHAKEEAGQLTVLIVVFALCLLMAVAAVTDISASYLRRQSIASLADGAALSATDGAAAAAVYGDPHASYVALDEAAARAAVDRYLRDVDAYHDFPGLRADVDVVDDTLSVRLQTPYRLPFPVPGATEETTIEATGSATLPIY